MRELAARIGIVASLVDLIWEQQRGMIGAMTGWQKWTIMVPFSQLFSLWHYGRTGGRGRGSGRWWSSPWGPALWLCVNLEIQHLDDLQLLLSSFQEWSSAPFGPFQPCTPPWGQDEPDHSSESSVAKRPSKRSRSLFAAEWTWIFFVSIDKELNHLVAYGLIKSLLGLTLTIGAYSTWCQKWVCQCIREILEHAVLIGLCTSLVIPDNSMMSALNYLMSSVVIELGSVVIELFMLLLNGIGGIGNHCGFLPHHPGYTPANWQCVDFRYLSAALGFRGDLGRILISFGHHGQDMKAVLVMMSSRAPNKTPAHDNQLWQHVIPYMAELAWLPEDLANTFCQEALISAPCEGMYTAPLARVLNSATILGDMSSADDWYTRSLQYQERKEERCR